jgi:hypothetical protein
MFEVMHVIIMYAYLKLLGFPDWLILALFNNAFHVSAIDGRELNSRHINVGWPPVAGHSEVLEEPRILPLSF